MSRTKAVLDEYLRNKNYSAHNQHVKYVPVDYQSKKLYSYDLPSSSPSRRINHRQNINRTEHKPNVRTYYIPVPTKHELVADETLYKHGGVKDHYMYQKAYSNYYLPESIQKTNPGDHKQHHSSVVYLKYPKPIREEKLSRYYTQIDGESGDYVREEDFYEYDNQNMEYYEPNRKSNYNNVFVSNEELYYRDYVPETSDKSQTTKTGNNSDYYSQYTPTVISQPEKKHKYYYEEDTENKNLFQEAPQRIKTTTKYSEPFTEPVNVKQEFDVIEKIDFKKSDSSESSTIYDMQSNNVPLYQTCTVSSQTSDSYKIEDTSLKFQLKECCSKCTQTLELDFMEKKINLSNKETQTAGDNSTNKTCDSTKDKKGNEIASTEDEYSNLTESMDATDIHVFSLEYVQLSKSRTNSFLCPKTGKSEQQKSQKRVEPFIFTATTRPKTRAKFSLPKSP